MPITPLMRKLAFELKQDFSFLAAGKKAENFIITAQGKKKTVSTSSIKKKFNGFLERIPQETNRNLTLNSFQVSKYIIKSFINK